MLEHTPSNLQAKLASIQNGEMELLISSYQSLHIAIKLANKAIQAFDPADYDFEHILKITSNFINQMNKYQKVNEVLERKLEKYDLLTFKPESNYESKSEETIDNNDIKSAIPKTQEITAQNQLILSGTNSKTLPAPKPKAVTQVEIKLTPELKQKKEVIESELKEIHSILVDKLKLKSMGHTKVRKLHKIKKELLSQLASLQKN